MNILNFRHPQTGSICLSMTQEMREVLKRISKLRGCSEKQLASEFLQCAIAEEVGKLKRLHGENWSLEEIKCGD